MITKRFPAACIAISLALTPATRVAADAGDLLGGLIVGGLIGGAIANENNKKRTVRTTSTKRVASKPGVSSATRAANREVQTSLNYFGYSAGTPDGVMGRNSRAAISQYQATLGYAPTGQLTQYERDFLVGSYLRAMAGGAATYQAIAANPQGARGLLLDYRDQAAGVVAQTPVAPVAEAPAVMAVAPVTEVPASTGLPTFMGASSGQSLASQCNKVSLLTNSNGGFTTEAAMTDAGFALSEQFCLARTYAIAQGEELAGRIQGFTTEQIAQQCEGIGTAMTDQVAAVSLNPRDQVIQDVSAFVLSTGMSPAQLSGTAKICLSVGYRTDNMDVAIGSALMLVVLGEPVYAELLGHHLGQGFGTSTRSDLSLAWYSLGLDALENGAVPVFAPGQPERTSLIRKAAYQTGGVSDPVAAEAGAAPQPVGMPLFAVPVK